MEATQEVIEKLAAEGKLTASDMVKLPPYLRAKIMREYRERERNKEKY